ncbi:MAG: AI-2E family transporter [Saprospirales bacterium]|nr:AI-2E family transporter [Saprospirales bacterium]
MRPNNRIIAISLGFLVALAFIYYFSNIVVYVAIAWVLSLMLGPLVSFFTRNLRIGKFKLGVTFSAALTMIIFLAGLSLLLTLFIPLIVTQANNLAGVDYKSIATALQEPLSHMNQWLINRGLVEQAPNVEEQLKNMLQVSDWFQPGKIGTFFSAILSTAGNVLAGFFSIVFITFFLLRDETMLPDFLAAILPKEYEEKVRHSFSESDRMLTRYFNGLVLQVSVLTVIMWILLSILGIDNALLIAFFGAMMNLVPYVGPIIGGIFGVFITISSHLDLDFYTQMVPMIIKVLAAFIGMQMLDNYFLQPYISSKSVRAHPLEIFIVILMGAKLNGIVGMVLAIPVYTVLRVIARTFWSEFRIVQTLTESLEEEEEEEEEDGHPR